MLKAALCSQMADLLWKPWKCGKPIVIKCKLVCCYFVLSRALFWSRVATLAKVIYSSRTVVVCTAKNKTREDRAQLQQQVHTTPINIHVDSSLYFCYTAVVRYSLSLSLSLGVFEMTQREKELVYSCSSPLPRGGLHVLCVLLSRVRVFKFATTRIDTYRLCYVVQTLSPPQQHFLANYWRQLSAAPISSINTTGDFSARAGEAEVAPRQVPLP